MKTQDALRLRIDDVIAHGRRLLKALRQPLTFLAVGLSSALVNALLSMALVALAGWTPVAAGVVAYIVMIPPTYLAQKVLTFEFRATKRQVQTRFLRYAVLQMLGLLTSAGANAIFSQATRAFHGVYFFISLLLSAGFNFLVMRLWVFAEAPAATLPVHETY